ncbi:hypothetical protein MMC20_002924 [Loxospora ochrophaea]|nr:hypothetical protein [Loxospora ochrophaea]
MLRKRRSTNMTELPRKRKKSASAIEEITFDPNAREDYLNGFHKRKLQRIKHAQAEAARREREDKISSRKAVSMPHLLGYLDFVTKCSLTKLREERKADLEKHVAAIDSMLEMAHGGTQSGDDGSETEDTEWVGIPDPREVVDRQEEYFDDDRHTTVTVEAVGVSRRGLQTESEGEKRIDKEDGEQGSDEEGGKEAGGQGSNKDYGERARYSESAIDTDASSRLKSVGKKRIWTKDRPERAKNKSRKKFRYESRAERKVTRFKERAGHRARAKARKE